MDFDEMCKAVNQAKVQLNLVDSIAGKLASLLVGRLRHVDSGWVLAQLKTQLRDFNAHTKTWRK
jgi:hypothetical protein